MEDKYKFCSSLVIKNGGCLGLNNYKKIINKHCIKYLVPKCLSINDRDEWVISSRVKLHLKYDLSNQEYYDIAVLGLTDINDRPKCKYCSLFCDFINMSSGYRSYCKNHRYKHTSELVSKKLKGRPLSEINKLHLSEAKKGKKLTEEQRLRRPRGYKFKLSSEARLKISLSKRNAKIYNCKMYKSGDYISSKCNEIIHYLSSYELDFLKICDSSKFIQKIEIPYPIPYVYLGVSHMYYPDFLITLDSGIRVLVEVKPKNLIYNDKVLSKKYSARKWCRKNNIKYITITQDSIYRTNKKYKKVLNKELNIYDLII
jgi:hypothetical protein